MATILVVDDDPHTRQLYASLLTPFGHEVLQAPDGRDGLKVAREQKPDLIVSDILMPTMNGYEFVSALRKLPGVKATAVVFQSASFLDHESRALGMSCGVQDYLSKPCDPEKILETVNRVLGLPAWQPASAPPPLQSADPVSLLVSAFYEKGQLLDALSLRLSTLIDFGIQMARLFAPEPLLETALNTARKVIGANYAGGGILTQDSAEDHFDFRCFSVAGLEPSAADKVRKQAVATSFQQIMGGGKVLRAFSSDGNPCSGHLPECHPPVRSLLGMPIQTSTKLRTDLRCR